MLPVNEAVPIDSCQRTQVAGYCGTFLYTGIAWCFFALDGFLHDLYCIIIYRTYAMMHFPPTVVLLLSFVLSMESYCSLNFFNFFPCSFFPCIPNRFCQRTKTLFQNLNVPHAIIELDERGEFLKALFCHLSLSLFSLFYSPAFFIASSDRNENISRFFFFHRFCSDFCLLCHVMTE